MTPGAPTPHRVAAIDLGTNTVRLLAVEAAGGGWRSVGQSQRITRLGEGQAAAGRLLEAPMRRTVAAVAELADMARRLGVSAIRVVATSAVREAPNRGEFAAWLRQATGLDLVVVSGEDEGRLAVAGVAGGLPQLGGTFLLFDIGGGSTEVVRAEGGRPTEVVSLPLGVVALAERTGDRGPVDWAHFRALRREVSERLAALPPRLLAAPVPPAVGTAGTVTTLAALDLGLARYETERVQGHRLGRPAVERLLLRLGPMTAAAREALPCVETGRGDLVVPGIAAVLAVLDRVGYEACLVSDRGLREGLVADLLAAGA